MKGLHSVIYKHKDISYDRHMVISYYLSFLSHMMILVILIGRVNICFDINAVKMEESPGFLAAPSGTCLKSLMQLWQQKRFCWPSTSRKWLADARLGR